MSPKQLVQTLPVPRGVLGKSAALTCGLDAFFSGVLYNLSYDLIPWRRRSHTVCSKINFRSCEDKTSVCQSATGEVLATTRYLGLLKAYNRGTAEEIYLSRITSTNDPPKIPAGVGRRLQAQTQH